MFSVVVNRLGLLRLIRPAALAVVPAAMVVLVFCLAAAVASTASHPSSAAPAGSASAAKTIPTVELRSLAVQDLAGTMVHPLTNDGRQATALFFVMHECPVANSYAPEISRILAEYAGRGIRGHVVYVEDDLTPVKARKHARDYGYKSTLLDPEHRLVRATGVTVSPEAAVVSASGDLLYRGRIDDRVADFGKKRVQPTRHDLRLALDAIVAGQAVATPRTKAIGCYIPDLPPPTSPAAHSPSK